mmetsp:Transcript_8923/g.19640  ORF Transcript_8923/g.19640 Transcript_8923/m.19640 type:complete len:82 (+) Transcript_8923:1805-2050(+)
MSKKISWASEYPNILSSAIFSYLKNKFYVHLTTLKIVMIEQTIHCQHHLAINQDNKEIFFDSITLEHQFIAPAFNDTSYTS